MGFKCNIEKILEDRGMKQKFIVDKLNMRRGTVSAIVRGSNTDIETALRIAKVLGMNIEDVWEIEDKED